MAKYLDSTGLKTVIDSIKNDSIVASLSPDLISFSIKNADRSKEAKFNYDCVSVSSTEDHTASNGTRVENIVEIADGDIIVKETYTDPKQPSSSYENKVIHQLSNKIDEAPYNGKNYVRCNKSWLDVEIPDPQQQADWNQANSSSVSYIKNKPTIPTIPGVATTSANGLMSSTDKTKLNNINVKSVAQVLTSGTHIATITKSDNSTMNLYAPTSNGVTVEAISNSEIMSIINGTNSVS